MNRRLAPITLSIAVILASCGVQSSEPRASGGEDRGETTTGNEESHGKAPEAPPPVTVRFFDDSVELEPWTYCYGNGCADGVPPEHPFDVGDPAEIIVEYPLEGWRFRASFRPPGDECRRQFSTTLEQIDEDSFLLRPAGYAGTYDVTLFGRGDGDLFTTFTWTTPEDGPLPEPKARLAVLADHDGQVDSYGVELEVRDLATTPKRASATITVRADDGDAVTFDAKRAKRGCRPDGTVYWDGPDAKGLEAAGLGGTRFTYEVEVSLDGETYNGTATWPNDVIEGNEPSVRLDFSPPLPALS